MAQQTINIGTAANDGTGDTIRDAFDKTNDNFTELYAADAALGDVVTLGQDEIVLESQRNAANGFAGLDADGAINALLKVRSGTAAVIDDLVLLSGELAAVVDGDVQELRLGDGSTSGGSLIFSKLQRATLATLESKTSNVTYADNAELVIDGLVAGAFYEWSAYILGTMGTFSGGIRARMRNIYDRGGSLNFSFTYDAAETIVDTQIVAPADGTGTFFTINGNGLFQLASGQTDVAFQWAQAETNVLSSSIYEGYITVRRVG